MSAEVLHRFLHILAPQFCIFDQYQAFETKINKSLLLVKNSKYLVPIYAKIYIGPLQTQKILVSQPLIPNSSSTSKQLQAQELFNVSLLNLCSAEKIKESLTGRAGCETYCQKVNNTSAISDIIKQAENIFRFISNLVVQLYFNTQL